MSDPAREIKAGEPKVLFFSPIGARARPLVESLLRRLTLYPNIDFLFTSYDGPYFDDLNSPRVQVISERGYKLQLAKKHLDPIRVRQLGYDYVMVWDDDLDVSTFDLAHFLGIVRSLSFEMAQPALTPSSYHSHKITVQRDGVARFTDFVEVMAPVFTIDAWSRFRNFIESDLNPWGYDIYAKSYCSYDRMGIVDCEAITHTRPVGSTKVAIADYRRLCAKLSRMYRRSLYVSYKSL